MTELLTAAQMRAIEMAAIESGEVTGLELMERAGQGVVDAVFEEWPELAQSSHRAVVLCGPGNNGGDGFVIARLLKEWGWEVEVFLYGEPSRLPPDARVNYERWRESGEVRAWNGLDAENSTCSLFFDAVFGTGIKRSVPDNVSLQLLLATAHDKSQTKVVAVDLPSGLCADSGKMLEGKYGVFCDLAVSFHTPKIGHVLEEAAQRTKKLVVKDIGLAYKFNEHHVHRVDKEWLSDDEFPLLSKWKLDHKYNHGHALFLTGGSGKTGAARLAARGALRIGAGLVTLGVPPSAQMEVASQITAIMLKRVADADALAEILEDPRFNALCLGPGLGMERARELVLVALADKTRSVVLDADALTAFQDNPETLFSMLHETCVLTPHEGEFKRLFPDLHEELTTTPNKGPAFSKVDATRDAAARAGCTILFKGPDTVIADQTGACSINSAHYARAAPWLATAGSGDVLAGFITGLMARGFAPKQAAETAAWLHVECARQFGPGLIAEDIPEQLPRVFRDLGL